MGPWKAAPAALPWNVWASEAARRRVAAAVGARSTIGCATVISIVGARRCEVSTAVGMAGSQAEMGATGDVARARGVAPAEMPAAATIWLPPPPPDVRRRNCAKQGPGHQRRAARADRRNIRKPLVFISFSVAGRPCGSPPPPCGRCRSDYPHLRRLPPFKPPGRRSQGEALPKEQNAFRRQRVTAHVKSGRHRRRQRRAGRSHHYAAVVPHKQLNGGVTRSPQA